MFGSNTTFARRLLKWYRQHRRDLPWRLPLNQSGHPHPYHVLISEAMLQQTQVATVIPYFHRFIATFPTVESLARADAQLVLRLWQGLGYYSRARNLHQAAQQIVTNHHSTIPSTITDLKSLPGIGRYTAGAISSIAFGRREPILDGNVARVLCRLNCIREGPRQKSTQEILWTLAEQILPKKNLSDFNSALMELGALICTPRSPKCLICPVRHHCKAFAKGLQELIPPPKKTQPTPILHRQTFCIRHNNHYLIEQRPPTGRWAHMWQFITRESNNPIDLKTSPPKKIGQIRHTLTHRRYVFDVFVCQAPTSKRSNPQQKWTTLEKITDYPLPRPHQKIAQLLHGVAKSE
jgi:A/G-specific adenine glycosylase